MFNNQIIEGDANTIIKDLPDHSVDLVVTDPPCLVNYRDRTGRTLANDDNPDAVLSVFPDLFRVLKPNSFCVLFCGWSAIDRFSQAWSAVGFASVGHIVWRKTYSSRAKHVQYNHESAWLLAKGYPTPPRQPLPDVLDWAYSGNRNHPTEKAVEVIAPADSKLLGTRRRGSRSLSRFRDNGRRRSAQRATLCRYRA